MYTNEIKNYLQQHAYTRIQLRAVLFDMDGVLFNSMPNHARAWHEAMARYGMHLSSEEAYMHEGRTGAATINLVSQRERGMNATPEEIECIYRTKTELFNSFPKAERMPGAAELIAQLKSEGLIIMVVTGSGQTSLLERLNRNFPNTFRPELMVTAYDVRHGKPNPEPYLMALEKAKLQPWEAIVVENAPMGVQAGVSAGIFTIAVNTGPLPDNILLDAGANLLFSSMNTLSDQWEELHKSFIRACCGAKRLVPTTVLHEEESKQNET